MNIPAADEDERTRLLLEVVDPLVHDELSDQVRTWFYFWEPELRLRIGWSDPGQAENSRAELARFLDNARADGRLQDWYEANHGNRRGQHDRRERELASPRHQEALLAGASLNSMVTVATLFW